MLMSSAFPRNGMRRGPGGSGSLVDFTLDVQTDKKATRETAPVTITMVSILPQMRCCSPTSVTTFYILRSQANLN